MIDLTEMIERQKNGVMLIEQLEPDEKDILKHYCSISAQALLELGEKQNAPINEVVINAVRTGIGLGLQLLIDNGEVK